MYTIDKARQLLDSGSITALELTKHYLKRIEQANPNLNTFITISREQAEKDALYAQQLIDSGKAQALTGIPFAISDDISTKDILTTCGSQALYNYHPVFDATVISKIKEQGAIILGKTNIDDFLVEGSNKDSHFGAVRNPLNNKKIAGCGAAAAVSAGLALAALSADSYGQLRQASAYCGVVGVKPSYGAVSRYGLIASTSSLIQIGAIANSSKDCATILQAIGGSDTLDMTSVGYNNNFTFSANAELKDKKIGIIDGCLMDADIKVAVDVAVAKLNELGCRTELINLPSAKYSAAAYYIISSAEASSNLARYDGIKFGHRSNKGDTYADNLRFTRSESFGKNVKRALLLGVHVLDSNHYKDYYQKAEQVRNKLRQECCDLLQEYDMLFCPTTFSLPNDVDKDTDLISRWEQNTNTALANLTGLPSASLTCGYSNGMPVGGQFIGKAFGDCKLLSYAHIIEQSFRDSKREAVE